MSLPRTLSPDDAKCWFDALAPGKVRWAEYQATCRSPLREDKSPSFSFNAEKCCWHDHATGEGGGLLALAERLGVAPPWVEEEKPSSSQPGAGFLALWDAAKAADGGHPYLQRKCISCTEGLRQTGEILLIPCHDESGALVGIERIAPDGAKRHLGSKQGVFPFGRLEPGSPVVLAEGFATGASLHEVTGLPALSTFGASGIKRTAEALRRKHPKLEIIAATDADEAGRRAAQESGALAVIPDGPEHCDWNDFCLQHGAEVTREAFLRRLEEARREGERKKPAILDVVTAPAPENAARPEKVWHFPRKHLNVLAADPGMGKSLMLSKVAADLSIGAAPLGGRAEPVRKTLYLNGECGRDYFNWRFRASGWKYSKEHFSVVHQETLSERGIELDLDTSMGRQNLEALLHETGPDLLVIDSLPAFSNEDLNDGTVQNELGKFLKGVAARHNLAVVLVTHLRKRRLQDHGAEPTLAEIQGSNAIAKLCNVALALYEKEIDISGELRTAKVCRSVKSWGPQVAPFGFHFPELDEDTLVLDAVDIPSSKKLSGAWERVRALLGGSFMRQEVEELLGVSDKTAKGLLSGWRQQGKIETIGKGPKTMYAVVGEGSGKALSILPRSGADEAIATVESGNPIFPRFDSEGGEGREIESGKNRFPDSNPVIPMNYIGSGKYIDCGVPIASPIDEMAAENSSPSADPLPPPAQERYRDAYERMRRANISHEIAHQRAMDRAKEVA